MTKSKRNGATSVKGCRKAMRTGKSMPSDYWQAKYEDWRKAKEEKK